MALAGQGTPWRIVPMITMFPGFKSLRKQRFRPDSWGNVPGMVTMGWCRDTFLATFTPFYACPPVDTQVAETRKTLEISGLAASG